MTVTVHGSDFATGAANPIVIVDGSGVTVASTSATSETTIDVSLSVAPDAPLRTRTVLVANAGTGPGAATTTFGACANCLTISE